MSSELFAPDRYPSPHEKPAFDALPLQQWPDQWHPTKHFPTPQSVGEGQFRQIANQNHSFRAVEQHFKLGDPELPVAPYRETILQTVESYQASVISSETGSGKSSQVPLYLLEEGYPRIFVTQPRILAARELKQRAELSLGTDYEHLAGYITGLAKDSDYGPDTRLFYVTEELLFKMANRGRLLNGDVIINDEAHERTPATILLQGLMKELLQDNPDMRLIISSATIDTEKFSRYLADPLTGESAPILSLPGRTHPIRDEITDDSVAMAARRYMKAGNNVLVFEPGIQRQISTRYKMQARALNQTVHLLYGDQSPTEQAEALNPEDGNHIVSNRVGETSITPQNKDVVVDSGLTNMGVYHKGERRLETRHSSKSTMSQRRGRVGRTHEGIYAMAIPENAPPIAYSDRDDYDPSPIETSSVAGLLVELLSAGRRIEDLSLLEHPNGENLLHDYKVLKRLGAIALDGEIVNVGEVGLAMTNLPLDPPLARMQIESRSIDSFYEVDVDSVRTQVAAAVAIKQVCGILNAQPESKRKYLRSRHNAHLSTEAQSDMLFELDVFINLRAKQLEFEERSDEDPKKRFEQYLRSKDILVNRYYKAFATFEEVCRREGLEIDWLTVPTDEERKAIIGCQIAGTDELFVQKSKLIHLDIRGDKRRLGRKSTINPSVGRLVIGTPFTYVGLRDTGVVPPKRTIAAASAVTTEMLLRHASHRISSVGNGHAVTSDGRIVEKQALYFDNEILFDEVYLEPTPTLNTREFIIRAMMKGVARDSRNETREVQYRSGTPNATNALKQWEKAQDLEHKSPAKLMVSDRYEKLIKRIVHDSVSKVPLSVTDPEAIDEVIPKVYLGSLVRPKRKRDIPEIIRKAPDVIPIHIGDEKQYVEVTYRKQIAYITLTPELKYALDPSDLTELAENYYVKIRVEKSLNSKYLQSEAFFKYIEEERNAPSRVKRRERRAQALAQESTPEGQREAVERLANHKKKSVDLTPVLHLLKRQKSLPKKRRSKPTNRESKEAKTTAS